MNFIGNYFIYRLATFFFVATAWAEKDLCKTCKDFAKNFEKGMEKTGKSNFGGGNTKWEEKSLGSYQFSETRLIEIMEHACDEKDCHSMVEEHEEKIEDWWFKYYAKSKPTKLEKYLCINTIQVCCPKGTYGKNCLECTGGKNRPCTGNGKCSGDGTRKGTGQCDCNAGYKGQVCDECQSAYFEELKNNTHTTCKKCDTSCEGECTGTGPEGCKECKKGWEMVEEKGCYDIDECEKDNPCKEESQYCTNNQGSYKCTSCHNACDRCTGPGADKCVQCAELYIEKDGKCQACHPSCANSCTDTTPDSCDSCDEGWASDAQVGCVDIDECMTYQANCTVDEFCVNNEGSYHCSPCHEVCASCTGAGISACIDCKDGYVKNDAGDCKDKNECLEEGACGENERCINSVGSFRCECKDGYIRKHEDCEPKPKQKKKKKNKGKKNKKKKEEVKEEEPVPSPDDDTVVLSGDFSEEVPVPPDSNPDASRATDEL